MADMSIRNPAVVASAPQVERIEALALVGWAARVCLRAVAYFLGIGEAEARARRTSRGFNDRAAEWSLFDPNCSSTSMLSRGSSR